MLSQHSACQLVLAQYGLPGIVATSVLMERLQPSQVEGFLQWETFMVDPQGDGVPYLTSKGREKGVLHCWGLPWCSCMG